MHVAAWVLLGPPAALGVTIGAGRLLGARRGWAALAVAGLIGWTGGVVVAGELTGWAWDSIDMALVALVLGTLFTMAAAVLIDLVAPVGSLAQGEEAGLVEVRNPVTAFRRRSEPVRRYRHVIALARDNGVLAARHDDGQLPAGVRMTLEQAGGIFVKLGQVASTRSDVLPRAWCDELAKLRSAADPAPVSVMKPHIAAELGAEPEEVFTSFDWEPLASASIAQVYRAERHDGVPVVLKAQRPGLDRVVAVDSEAIRQIAAVIERRTRLGVTMRPVELADEFLDGVAEELDFTVEMANAVEMADGLAPLDRVRVPAVFPDQSGRRILTEEFVAAPNVGEQDRLLATGHDPGEIAHRVLEAFLHQIFEIGIFHADPHPGNLLVEADGTVVFIDLGAVGRIGPAQRSAVLDMLSAASSGDARLLRQALSQITPVDSRADLRALDEALETFLAQHMRAGGGITAAAFDDLAALIGRYGLRLPRWFGTLIRTMVTLEGTLQAIDAEFSLVDAAREHAEQRLGRPSLSSLREVAEREALVQMPRLRRLPERVDELLGQAATGRLRASVSVLADERDERLVTRLLDRLVLAIIAAATGLASVFLLGIESGPELGEAVSLNEVLGYFGIAAASALALRIVAGIIRDGET
jgi:ubiquinone biosynthesis protein